MLRGLKKSLGPAGGGRRKTPKGMVERDSRNPTEGQGDSEALQVSRHILRALE
jgi:hypothetical protein